MLQEQLSSIQLLSPVWPFATPRTSARQASLPITNSWNLLKLMSIEPVMPSNHLILCRPFSSCLQSFPASASFPMSQFFASGSQSIKASASASVLPMNIQDWFPLGLTGWIFWLSKGLSRVSSSTTGQKHQFFSAHLHLSLLILGSELTTTGHSLFARNSTQHPACRISINPFHDPSSWQWFWVSRSPGVLIRKRGLAWHLCLWKNSHRFVHCWKKKWPYRS